MAINELKMRLDRFAKPVITMEGKLKRHFREWMKEAIRVPSNLRVHAFDAIKVYGCELITFCIFMPGFTAYLEKRDGRKGCELITFCIFMPGFTACWCCSHVWTWL